MLVGAAQYINCFAGIRSRSNVKLAFTPGRGFNEGALQAVISSRTGSGVAKGMQLLLDYGPEFNMTAAAQAAPRSGTAFRGALEVCFDSQRQLLPAEAAAHDAAVKEEVNAELEVAEESRKRQAEEEQVAEVAKKQSR